jgi:hypothetical protein
MPVRSRQTFFRDYAAADRERTKMDTDRAGALLAGDFIQMAYVTSDLEAAIALFAKHHDVASFLRLPNYQLAIGDGREAWVDIALAYAGGVQIEIIRPLSGDDRVYRQALSPDQTFQLRYHHEAHRAASLDQLGRLKARAAARGMPIPIDASDSLGAHYFYADCRATIGHHVEYIYYPDELWSQLQANIPVNA